MEFPPDDEAGARPSPEPSAEDDRLGEAMETYLAEAESGTPPDPREFAERFPELGADLEAALDVLSLMRRMEEGGPRLDPGRCVAGYRIVRELGRGGMGVVYEAVHVDLDRPVALKVLDGSAAPDSPSRRRFLNEARTAAGLHHTHIVPVFDVGRVGDLCYYAMQRIRGKGLDGLLRHLRDEGGAAPGSQGRSGGREPLAPCVEEDPKDPEAAPPAAADEVTQFIPPRGAAYYRWAADVGRMAAEALDFAHRRGIVHRDVKPSNLLVDDRGMVWMTDFGLARRLSDPGLTHHGGLLGTPRYMSPEQSRPGPIDGRSDVYSLGATLYELLTLRPPFPGESASGLIEQVREREPEAPRRADPKVPRDLETIVLKALAKRPADRYATAGALAEDLGRFLRHEPVRARRVGPIGRSWRVARRHPVTSLVTAAAAATVLAVVSVAYVHGARQRDVAVRARAALREATRKTVEATRASRAAVRKTLQANRAQLWREASFVRLSGVPNRRLMGLALLKDAAALGDDPALLTNLRDEAVELLALRDVEARPGFETERALAVAFDPAGTRFAALFEDGEGAGLDLGLWDVARRDRLAMLRLPDVIRGGPGVRPPRVGRAGDHRRRGPAGMRLAVVGDRVVASLPDRQGFRIFDSGTGAHLLDQDTEGRQVLAIVAAPEDRRGRFATVEAALGVRPRPRGDRPPSPVEFQVRLWEAGPGPPGADGGPRCIGTLDRWTGSLMPFPMVALGPGGEVVATATPHKTAVALWSGDDGASLGEIDVHCEPTALAVGARGQLAAAGDQGIGLWDIPSKGPRARLDTRQNPLRILRFNASGGLLAAAGMMGSVELWDTGPHSLVSMLPTPERVTDMAFAPDGKSLAIAGSALETSVWTIVESEARACLEGIDARPVGLRFRGDGLLAVATGDRRIGFWRPGQGRAPCLDGVEIGDAGDELEAGLAAPSPAPPPLRRRPVSLGFDDRDRLIALSPTNLRVWSPPWSSSPPTRVALPGQRRPRRILPPPLTWTADRRRFLLGHQGSVVVWRSDAPEECHLLEPPASAAPPQDDEFAPDAGPDERTGWRSLAVAPAGDRLYLVDMSGVARAWSLDLDHDRARREEWAVAGDAVHLTLSPDGRALALADRTEGVALIDPATGAVRARLRAPDAEVEGLPWAFAFSPDGRQLAVSGSQGPIQVWSLADPSAPLLHLPSHRGHVMSLAYDPTGRYLAAVGSGKRVDVWDMTFVRAALTRIGLGW